MTPDQQYEALGEVLVLRALKQALGTQQAQLEQALAQIQVITQQRDDLQKRLDEMTKRGVD